MIYSGLYNDRNYLIDTNHIINLNINDIKYSDSVIYAISGNWCDFSQNTSLYIGSTNDHRERTLEHLQELRENNHFNDHLQNAFNKHNQNEFSYFILERCEEQYLLDREQNWLDYYNSFNNKTLFNHNTIANKPPIFSKKYIITNPKGDEFVIENLEKFCRENNLNPSGMRQVLRGKSENHKKWKCRKITDNKQLYECKRINSSIAKYKYYIITFPDGHQEVIFGLTKFCKENNLSYNSMKDVIKGKMISHRGFKCEKMK